MLPASPCQDAADRAEMNQFNALELPRLSGPTFKRLFLKHLRDDSSVHWRALRHEARSYLDDECSDASDDDDRPDL